MVLENILQKAKKKIPGFDEKIFNLAYKTAEKRLKGKYRKNGQAAICHSLAVANILIDIHPDETTLISALLHNYPKSEEDFLFLEKKFGKPISLLIRKTKEIADLTRKNTSPSEVLRDFLRAIKEDLRIVILRFCERLHSLQTLEFLPEKERKSIAQETLMVYAPVASRLGIYAIKAPLEDLAFYYLYPKKYEMMSSLVTQYDSYKDRVLKFATRILYQIFKKEGLKTDITGRIKHLYSMFQKFEEKKIESLDEVFDIFALRILVTDIPTCYAVLGLIHEHFSPLSKRFKDYIALPKNNGYRSLHTTVMGLANIGRKSYPIEVQIRTFNMNEEAEYGVAAHWNYKEKRTSRASLVDSPHNWNDEFLEMEKELLHTAEQGNGNERISHKYFSDRIVMFTPKGDAVSLPVASTALDFAFAVHSNIGLHVDKIFVNQKEVPLDYQLHNDDIVRVTISKKTIPQEKWLKLCITSKARNNIRNFLKEFHKKK